MRICKISNCGKKHAAKGYCYKHYNNLHYTGNPLGLYNGDRNKRFAALHAITRKAFICKIKGCGEKHYAKKYCKKHYATFVIRGGYKLGELGKRPTICKVGGCSRKPGYSGYCFFHRWRLKRGIPLNLPYYCNKGERNGNWNGGTSEYYHHYLMKKMRLLKLQEQKGKCEVCGKTGYQIHHKDHSKDNHNLKNLILVCQKCHGILERGRKNKTSKFIRLYGMTIEKISKKINKSCGWIYSNHRRGILDKYLTKK